jgi:short-subunit dehydrogenase
VHVIAQDLGLVEGPAAVKAQVEALGLHVGLLVNNAGYGSWGEFHTLDIDSEARMVDLNCRGTMLMAAHFAPAMLARKNGAIIITASTAALQPCPYFANYAATKAYDLALAAALWAEMKPQGVDVMAICPGYTRTEFQQVAGIDKELAGAWRLPEQVVDTCFAQLGRGPAAVDGWLNWAAGVGVKFIPRSAATRIAYGVLKRMSA